MKKDCFNTLERSDFEFDYDWEIKYDTRCIEFPIDYHFDVDKKFGLNSANGGKFDIHLYAEYNPIESTAKLKYYVDTDKDYYVGTYELNEYEKPMFVSEMEKKIMVSEKMTGKAFYLSEYFQHSHAAGFELYCDDTQEELRIVNRNDGFVVLCEGDASFADYLNDDIVCTFYEHSKDFVIKSGDTGDVLYDSRTDQISQQEMDNILHPEEPSRWQTLLAKAVCYIGEEECGEELYDTLHSEIGMTDDEIEQIGFSSLSEYFGQEENEGGMTMQ